MPFWNATIIGSGITGLTSAIFLKRKHPSWNISVLERGALPSGASTRNAGFACFGSVSEILDDLDKVSENEVFELISKRYQGLEELRRLLGDEKIGYAPTGGFEIFREDREELYKECLGSLGYINAELVQVIGQQAFKDASDRIDEFGFKRTNQMLVNTLEGTIDTGLMMKNLVDLAMNEGVKIFNGINVHSMEVESNRCVLDTNFGEILTERGIVCTNGFASELFPNSGIKPCRGQVLVTSQIDNLRWSGSFHHEKGYDYFRDIDGRVMLGGGRHLEKSQEDTDEFGTTGSIQNYLETLLKEVIIPDKEFRIVARWSGIMGFGESKSYTLEKKASNAYGAYGFGGMGVALGSWVGKQVAELVE